MLVPSESSWSGVAGIAAEDLRGQTVLSLDPSQHTLMNRAIVNWLSAGGAQPYHHFEACHAVAVERYAATRRLPCISLGWFGDGSAVGMVNKQLIGLDWQTDLVLLRA